MMWNEDMNPDERVAFNKRVLEQLRFHSSIRVKRWTLEQDYDIDFDALIYRAEAMITADKLAGDVYTGWSSFQIPASSWQHFKQEHESSWWLGWLVRRRPVENNTECVSLKIKLDRYLLYPDAPEPKLGRHVIHEIVREV